MERNHCVSCFVRERTVGDNLYSQFDGVFRCTDNDHHVCSVLFTTARSCTYIAYGETNSGKSHTLRCLMDHIASTMIQRIPIRISCIEVYHNDVFNLATQRTKLKHYTDTYPHCTVSTLLEYRHLMNHIKSQRTSRNNGKNKYSSRSHMICVFTIGARVYAFVDLAGSEERIDADSYHINMSLLCLRDCIQALNTKSRHIPYRRSKLTLQLRPYLERNIVCICTIFPEHIKQTKQTLEYGISMKGLSYIERSVSNTTDEMKMYLQHTKRMCNLEEKLVRKYIEAPHDKSTKKLLRNMLNHRQETTAYMLAMTL